MARPARALLDPGALLHNLGVVRRHAPNARIMAVVKANAYGHGSLWAAQTLHDQADAFAVASVEEGAELRAGNITRPVCVLQGFHAPDDLALIAHNRLETVVHHDSQIEMIEARTSTDSLPVVWLKVDTGMHRLGFALEDIGEILARLRRCKGVAEIRLMSHLANADDTADTTTTTQLARFATVHEKLGLAASVANSAGILGWRASHYDWVRPGIMLYGGSPLLGKSADELGLKPAMVLSSALMAVQRRRRGDPVGYGGDYRCPEDMPVGVVAIGYGDGYPRHARPGTPVFINGTRVSLIGRVSMDMITVDLRHQPHARVGDPAVLWGGGLAVDEIAAHAGTIAYELLCHVSARVPRVPLGVHTRIPSPAESGRG